MCPMKSLPFFTTVQTMIYYFDIKELTNRSKGKFECLGEYTEKYKTFSIPVEKEMVMKVL